MSTENVANPAPAAKNHNKPHKVASLDAARFAKLRDELEPAPSPPPPETALELEVRERIERFSAAPKIELLASEVHDHVAATGVALGAWHERLELAGDLLGHDDEGPTPEPCSIRLAAGRMRVVAGVLQELGAEMHREAGALDVVALMASALPSARVEGGGR